MRAGEKEGQTMHMIRTLAGYHELMAVLIWKNVAVRYKQAYLGIGWAILKPVTLLLIFMLVRSFVGIETGGIPYPVLTFAALLPWIFFQEAAGEGVGSVVSHASLVRKIYFPREIFPLTAVFTKLVELGINFVILAGLMVYYQMGPTAHMLWVPVIIFYTVLLTLSIALFGAAMNVYFRDVAAALPIFLSFLMYASPVIYPLSLVKEKLLVNQAAGEWSGFFYAVYTLNPLAGIIDAFQRVVLQGLPPDPATLWPGMVLTAVLLPAGYAVFKRAEAYFADVV